mgnify:CR=1 FL=1
MVTAGGQERSLGAVTLGQFKAEHATIKTEGTIEIEDGALYTSLHRLERRGWVSSDWGVSENNRRAKYYSLTDAGAKQLAVESTAWTRYAEAVFKVIRSTEALA